MNKQILLHYYCSDSYVLYKYLGKFYILTDTEDALSGVWNDPELRHICILKLVKFFAHTLGAILDEFD